MANLFCQITQMKRIKRVDLFLQLEIPWVNNKGLFSFLSHSIHAIHLNLSFDAYWWWYIYFCKLILEHVNRLSLSLWIFIIVVRLHLLTRWNGTAAAPTYWKKLFVSTIAANNKQLISWILFYIFSIVVLIGQIGSIYPELNYYSSCNQTINFITNYFFCF